MEGCGDKEEEEGCEGGWMGRRWGGDGERVRGGRVGKAERRHGGHLWRRMGCRD